MRRLLSPATSVVASSLAPRLLAASLALLVLAAAVRARIELVRADPDRTLTVTSNADSGPGSLRQAIADAGEGDGIRFAVAGDITLLRPLVIDKGVTIEGPGADTLAIRGGDRVRLFRVARGGELTLRGLTLADGRGMDEPPTPRGPTATRTPRPTRAPTQRTSTPTPPADDYPRFGGGAILNQGVLTVEDCVFEHNSDPERGEGGGAIYSNRGVVTIRRSLFLGNRDEGEGGGGAIHLRYGQMTITDSSFQTNVSVVEGNAVMNWQGKLVIIGSTFLRNKPLFATEPSGIAVIWSDTPADGELVLANSTLAHNDASVAGQVPPFGLASQGITAVYNTTFLNSRIHRFGDPSSPRERFSMWNSLLVSTEGDHCIEEASIDGGNNLQFPDASCGTSIPVVDPLLDRWVPGSGPALAISLATNSPAIDAGDAAACAEWPVLGVDARGLLRGGDGNGDGIGGCDIGAFEASASITATPTLSPTAGPSRTPSMTRTPSTTPEPPLPSGLAFLPIARCQR